jgi:hypothetical protein
VSKEGHRHGKFFEKHVKLLDERKSPRIVPKPYMFSKNQRTK